MSHIPLKRGQARKLVLFLFFMAIVKTLPLSFRISMKPESHEKNRYFKFYNQFPKVTQRN
jgi:hypothetical protein